MRAQNTKSQTNLPAMPCYVFAPGIEAEGRDRVSGLGSREPDPHAKRVVVAPCYARSCRTLSFRIGSSRHTAHSSKVCRSVVVSPP